MSGQFVKNGATLDCPLCSSSGVLVVSHTEVQLQDTPCATNGDKSKSNLVFGGVCKKWRKSPPPCASVIAPTQWKGVATDLEIDGEFMLLEGSTIGCATGGVDISILHTAQLDVPTDLPVESIFALIQPAEFIIGTNIIASIQRKDGIHIGQGWKIKVGDITVENYWLDNNGIAYFVPPKFESEFNSQEVFIQDELFDLDREVKIVSDPEQSILALTKQLDVLHEFVELPISSRIKYPKGVKDFLLRQGYYRFELALNDLENRHKDTQKNKELSNSIYTHFKK